MIRSNLSILLAERNLKISKVSKDTGISRTTLTSLSSNNSQGIQFDTFNKLCSYLKVNANDLFSFIPYDISIGDLVQVDDESFNLPVKIIDSHLIFDFTLLIYVYNYKSSIIKADITFEVNQPDSLLEKSIDYFYKLPVPFRTDFEENVKNKIINYYKEIEHRNIVVSSISNDLREI